MKIKYPTLLLRPGSKIFRAIAILLLSLGLVPVCALFAQTQTRQIPADSLIYDLKNPDPVRRKEAALQLGNNKVQRATPDLVAACGDSDVAVRREIAIALDKMLDPRALPAFVKLSSDPEKEIRDRCINGIINLYLPRESGLSVTLNKMANFLNPWSDEWSEIVVEPDIVVDPSAIAAMSTRMRDSDDGIRAKAARALGILRGREAIPALLEALRQDRSNNVRFEIVRSLRKIGDASIAKELMNYISYNDPKIRNEAIFTLGRFRYNAAVPELTRLYEKEAGLPPTAAEKGHRENLLDALAFIADPASKNLFIKEMANPENLIRLHAVEGLARIGDPSAITEISRHRLSEKDAKIQTAQDYALYRMGRKEYLDSLVKAMVSRKTSGEARQYLVELKPENLPDLFAAAKSNDIGIREGLAEVFGLIGDNSAVPTLQELSKDRRGQVASLANQALRRINARNGKM